MRGVLAVVMMIATLGRKKHAMHIFIVDSIRNACIMVIKMNNKPRGHKMETAIITAAETYAKLNGKMNTKQVLEAIDAGDQVILRSVLKLMEVTA